MKKVGEGNSHLIGVFRKGFMEAGTSELRVDRKVPLPISEMGGSISGHHGLSDVHEETEPSSTPRIHSLCPGHL